MLITSIYRSNTRLHDHMFYKFDEVKGVGEGRSVETILIAVGLFLFPILSIKLVKLITHDEKLKSYCLEYHGIFFNTDHNYNRLGLVA